MQVRGGGNSGEVAEGFWIRRSASPVAARAGSWRPHSFICADGKENVSCCGGRRRSPLPEWYPRTPLRDITTIIDALERRRIRVQAVQAQQRNLRISASPGSSHHTSPQEQSVSAQPPLNQVVSSDISEATPNSAVPAPTTPSPVMHQPQASSTSPTSSQAENTVHISSSPTDVEQPEPNIKLRSLIDEIEKMVIENMMRSPEEPLKRTKQRSTLMLLR